MARSLHRLLVMTDASQARAGLLDQLSRAGRGGAFAVVVREKHLPAVRRQNLVGLLADRLPHLEFIVADPTWSISACHLSSSRSVPVPRPALVGRSAHVGDVPVPGVDYITYSPIHRSASKPGYGPAIGSAGLAEACATSPVPVYALGGMETVARVVEARRSGAYGVAVMGAVMRARDPQRLVEQFLMALEHNG